MSVTLILTKSLDGEDVIGLDEWLQFVKNDAELSLVLAPTERTNPFTGATLSISPSPGQTEWASPEGSVPFLSYHGGDLVTRWHEQFENPHDPLRLKIGQVAKSFGAIIKHDAGDDILEW